jgi:hydroxymethylglutaryl-CoA reductase (NADPH)
MDRMTEKQAGSGRESARFEAACRWNRLRRPGARSVVFDQSARDMADEYQKNIENYIGTVSVPVGIAGPLRIQGEEGQHDYHVPLATTEAALVASYNRGARLLTLGGGCRTRIVDEGVSRTPMFAFRSIIEAARFADFVATSEQKMRAIVPEVTRHGALKSVRSVIEGNHVYVDLRFTTGDAAGQNMVTFVSDAICRQLVKASPVSPDHWFLEANLSGDKKATSQSLADVRGKRVVADIELPADLVAKGLHTSSERMVEYWYGGALGGVLSGTTGVQGHFANGLAALYLACGQDIACVAESATGLTRMQTTDDGGLYASVTLPNVMVGTVGGGTGLPSAKACLDILGLSGPGKARRLAEVCAATVLAGELSIIGAFCSGDFANAHRALSRNGHFSRGEGHD